jgi:predicted nucleotidyltransferase
MRSAPHARNSTPVEELILTEVVRRLVQTLDPDCIHLFGSRARGDATEGSDYDLMVIVPSSDLPQHRRAERAYGSLWGIDASVDVLVWTREQFDRQAHVTASLPAAILREGRLLYAA